MTMTRQEVSLVLSIGRRNLLIRRRASGAKILLLVLLPLVQALILLAILAGPLGLRAGAAYAAYVVGASLIWSASSQVILALMTSMSEAGPLVRNLVVRHELLVLAAAIPPMVIASASLLVGLVVNLVVFRPGLHLLLLPAAMLLHLGLIVGLGGALSLWTLRRRELRFLVEAAVQLMFYLTPILYRFEDLPERLRIFSALNPFTGVMTLYASALQERRVCMLAIVNTLVWFVCCTGAWARGRRTISCVAADLV